MLIAVCARCGLRSYPAPLICSQCRETGLNWIDIHDVTVIQATQSPGADSAIATVTGEGGPRMIARVPAGAIAGDQFEVVEVDTPGCAFVPPDPRAPRG